MQTILQNIPYYDVAWAVGIFLATIIGAPILVKIIWTTLLRTCPPGELREQLKSHGFSLHKWFYFVLAATLASTYFEIPEKPRFVINLIASSLILAEILIVSSRIIRFGLSHTRLTKNGDGQPSAISQNLLTIAIITVWVLAYLIMLDNFGFNVATLIAGLGIGGIAIGFALQAVLGDLFASFAIGLDKPFEVGDFIIQGEYLGTVEKIGLKTTRVRSLGGELLIFSNNDLMNSRVRNYKRMNERRIVFQIGVTYDTKQEHLEEIPIIIRKVIEDIEDARFDRAHFAKFGNFSLDFEIVYYVLKPDYNIYMDLQQMINLRIREEFLQRSIAFAFPTTTIDFPAFERQTPRTGN